MIIIIDPHILLPIFYYKPQPLDRCLEKFENLSNREKQNFFQIVNTGYYIWYKRLHNIKVVKFHRILTLRISFATNQNYNVKRGQKIGLTFSRCLFSRMTLFMNNSTIQGDCGVGDDNKQESAWAAMFPVFRNSCTKSKRSNECWFILIELIG